MTRRLSGYAIAGALAGTTSLLTADIIATNWDDPNTYGYLTMYMPDFDQQRLDDLPNDGRCHCGPTMEADLLAWIATHGFPQYAPGQANWQSQANYDFATDIIDVITNELGSFWDGTTGPCGTTQDEIFLNLQARVGDRFTVNSMNIDLVNGQSVTLSDMAQVGEQGGSWAFGTGAGTGPRWEALAGSTREAGGTSW